MEEQPRDESEYGGLGTAAEWAPTSASARLLHALSGGAEAAGEPVPPEPHEELAPPPSEPPPAARAEAAAPAGARLVSTLVGRRIGAYQVERRLGGGAMASVYAATELATGRKVALKVLLPDADATVRERFRLEARTVSELDHPHIVHTLAVGGHDEGPLDAGTDAGADALDGGENDAFTFIAMELVEGESLGDLLDRVHVLNAHDAATLLAPIARALAYAHGRNVVHRDVKPSNILLRRAAGNDPHAVRLAALDGPVVPLLSDFGIARALDAPDLTSAGRTIGTPAYMSPEQCAGSREITGRADIYSLGAVLYRALVGRSPYSGTTTQILYAHVYEPLTIAEEVLRTLPPLLVEVLGTALAKDPAARYADAQRMADDLELCVRRPTVVAQAQAAVAPGEATATMSNLEAAAAAGSARTTAQTSTVVLVPGPALGGAMGRPTTESVRPVTGGYTAVTPPTGHVLVAPAPPATIYLPPPAAARAELPLRQRRMRGLLVALALALPIFALLAVAVAALLSMGPFGRPAVVGVVGTPTAAVPTSSDVSSNPLVTGATPAGSIAAESTQPLSTPQPGAEGSAPAVEPSAAASPAAPTPTPEEADGMPAAGASTPISLPTPAGDIVGFWDDARAFYEDRDWGSALSWLTLVQRIDPGFEQAQVERMLADVYVAMGTRANARSDGALAVQQLEQAVALQPQNAELAALLRATTAYLAAEGAGAEDARRLLQIAHTTYGERLLRDNRVCDAADQVAASARILPESRTTAAAEDLATRCSVLLIARADQRLLESLTGRMLYSTQLPDGRYATYTIATTPGSSAELLLADARQPALALDGMSLAYHATAQGQQGLALLDLTTGAPAQRLTSNTGDAADSPPAWNNAANLLVYAGTRPPDARSSIYRLERDGGNPQLLVTGSSPAWSAATDLIAYNGFGPDGRAPGLYLMRPTGAVDASYGGLLTDNGNDIRPAWAPDGSSLLLMSSGRSQSWDLFQVTLESREVTQLTTDQGQDGLPTFSPDGRFAAWVSDRGGRWNIWVRAVNPAVVTSILGPSSPGAGGAPRELLMAPIEGTLTNWLEHSLQWLP